MGKRRLFLKSVVICTVLVLVALALIRPNVMKAQDQPVPEQDQAISAVGGIPAFAGYDQGLSAESSDTCALQQNDRRLQRNLSEWHLHMRHLHGHNHGRTDWPWVCHCFDHRRYWSNYVGPWSSRLCSHIR